MHHPSFSFLKLTTGEGLMGWSEFSEGRSVPGLTATVRKASEQVICLDPCQIGIPSAKDRQECRVMACAYRKPRHGRSAEIIANKIDISSGVVFDQLLLIIPNSLIVCSMMRP
jgi:hypothetical protein